MELEKLEWPLRDLRELVLVWPKDLDESELKLKRGQRIKYRVDPGKTLIEYETLGLVWKDTTGKKNDPLLVPQRYVWRYPIAVKEKKPQLAKEVKLHNQTITQLNEDGEKFRVATQDFDDLEFC